VTPIRLQKILARAGFGSRRACEQLIRDGEVMIDGITVKEMGVRADPRSQKIVCHGRRIQLPPLQVWAYHKPRGVLAITAKHPKARTMETVVKHLPGRFFPIGRLDREADGLLLLTNDGEFCNMLAHPRYGIPRTYHAEIRGSVTPELVARLRRGVWLAEGKTGPIQVRVQGRPDRERTRVEVTIREGMNREVRRVFARFGLKVRRLTRVRIDGISLGGLAPGRMRRIDGSEVHRLKREIRGGSTFDDE
jgi:pseudouridine synthase